MESIAFRRATLQDAVAMSDLNKRLMEENYPLSSWESILDNPTHCSFVAYEGDTLIGYILTMIQTNFLYFTQEGQVASYTVDDKYRQKGIGAKLMKLSLDCLRKQRIRICTLHVRVDNFVAQYIYRSFGFVVSRVEKAYYSDGTDAYVMHLML